MATLLKREKRTKTRETLRARRVAPPRRRWRVKLNAREMKRARPAILICIPVSFLERGGRGTRRLRNEGFGAIRLIGKYNGY